MVCQRAIKDNSILKHWSVLIGVLNHASSNIGRHKLKSWLQRPLLDFDAIKYRQDSVAYFVEKSSNDENKELRNNLKYIANAARLVSRIREQHASPNDWLQLLQVYRMTH